MSEVIVELEVREKKDGGALQVPHTSHAQKNLRMRIVEGERLQHSATQRGVLGLRSK